MKKLELAKRALARHPLLGLLPSAALLPLIGLARPNPWLAVGLAAVALSLALVLSAYAREALQVAAQEKRQAALKAK